MPTKMSILYSLIRRLASYKICLCFIVLSVTVVPVGYRIAGKFGGGKAGEMTHFKHLAKESLVN